MADFKISMQKILKTQGMHHYFDEKTKLTGDQILCSDCFNDEGLRLDAFAIGIKNTNKCPNCGSEKGHKLTKELVRELCYRFFVRGTIQRFEYGGIPLIQMNEHRFNNSDIHVSPWLEADTKLIEQAGEIGLFYYEPRFWMLGEIEPLKSLQNPTAIDTVVERILQLYPKDILNETHPFYRVRTNPKVANEFSEYDSPPDGFGGNNRFDSNGAPVLYASPDLDLCLHECRVSVEDDLFVAKLIPTQPLKMLNLAHLLREEKVDEFTSLDLAVHFLFLAGKHSYSVCGHIAQRIREQGFDGIIYPSYFSHVRTGTIPFDTVVGMSIRRIPPLEGYAYSQSVPNVALFGRPIKEGKVVVHSINKVIINSIQYEKTFGPAYNESRVTQTNTEEYLKIRKKELENKVRESFNMKPID